MKKRIKQVGNKNASKVQYCTCSDPVTVFTTVLATEETTDDVVDATDAAEFIKNAISVELQLSPILFVFVASIE